MSGTMRALVDQHGRRRHQGLREEAEPGRRGLSRQAQGAKLNLQVGFSHPVVKDMPAGVKVDMPDPDRDRDQGLPTARRSARSPPRFARSVRPSPTRARASATRTRRSRSKRPRRSKGRTTMLTKKDQRLRRSRQTRIRIAMQRVARLTVHRTNLHIYASVISDDGTKVLASASTAEADVRKDSPATQGRGKGGNVAAAALIGKRIAEKAKAAGIEKVAFDRAGFALPRPRQGAGRGGARSRPAVLNAAHKESAHGKVSTPRADRRQRRRPEGKDDRGQPRHQGRQGRPHARASPR